MYVAIMMLNIFAGSFLFMVDGQDSISGALAISANIAAAFGYATMAIREKL